VLRFGAESNQKGGPMFRAVETMISFTEIKPTANEATEVFRCDACGATVSRVGQLQHRSWHEDIREIAQKMSQVR
jgi:hypothetical protein